MGYSRDFWARAKPAPSVRVVTTRAYRMECPSCHGSGHSRRCLPGSTNFETCKGCEGQGWVTVSETTTSVGGLNEPS